jgi:hypothetical protein
VRHTSVEAYRTIEFTDLLGQRQWQAYQIVFKHGPMTANELCKVAGKPGLWKRLSELERFGLVQAVGERPCKITGMNATLWEVTNGLPSKPIRKKSNRQIIRELREEIQGLRRGLDMLT